MVAKSASVLAHRSLTAAALKVVASGRAATSNPRQGALHLQMAREMICRSSSGVSTIGFPFMLLAWAAFSTR